MKLSRLYGILLEGKPRVEGEPRVSEADIIDPVLIYDCYALESLTSSHAANDEYAINLLDIKSKILFDLCVYLSEIAGYGEHSKYRERSFDSSQRMKIIDMVMSSIHGNGMYIYYLPNYWEVYIAINIIFIHSPFDYVGKCSSDVKKIMNQYRHAKIGRDDHLTASSITSSLEVALDKAVDNDLPLFICALNWLSPIYNTTVIEQVGEGHDSDTSFGTLSIVLPQNNLIISISRIESEDGEGRRYELQGRLEPR